MNCSDSNEKLSDYIDGTLGRADTETLEAHLATCPGCRREVESLRALRAATAGLKIEVSPQRDLWPEIKAQVDKRAITGGRPERTGGFGPPQTTRSFFWRPGFAIARDR